MPSWPASPERRRAPSRRPAGPRACPPARSDDKCLRGAARRSDTGPPARSNDEARVCAARRGAASGNAGPAQPRRLSLGSLVVGDGFGAGAGTPRPAQRARRCPAQQRRLARGSVAARRREEGWGGWRAGGPKCSGKIVSSRAWRSGRARQQHSRSGRRPARSFGRRYEGGAAPSPALRGRSAGPAG